MTGYRGERPPSQETTPMEHQPHERQPQEELTLFNTISACETYSSNILSLNIAPLFRSLLLDCLRVLFFRMGFHCNT